LSNIRVIGRLDVKGAKLIKGIHLEGLRVVGDPHEHALRYYREGIDELVLMDVVASLYGRNSLRPIIEATAREIFIPLTVGGGVRSVDNVRELLRSGADKVAVNTAAIRRPELITEIAQAFGSQCMVVSIEAKRKPGGGWEALTDNGREHTGRDAIAWAAEACERGAGEILLTSVDKEGTRKGFDLELTRAVASAAPVPVIAAGGMGRPEHLVEAVREGRADAAAIASVLHYNVCSLADIRAAALAAGVAVRPVDPAQTWNPAGPLTVSGSPTQGA
jgi:cyclase